jgi:hypothetical protein
MPCQVSLSDESGAAAEGDERVWAGVVWVWSDGKADVQWLMTLK